ncbi:MAG: ThiF family adenylyltransferase [Akkermansiaceae bacterium]
MIAIERITLIGAGGTGSMILPAIAPTHDVTIYDGDDYEEKNVTRQIFANESVGKNKAVVLADIFNRGPSRVVGVPSYARGNESLDTDLILCCVDNNDGRKAAKALANEHDVPLIVCGNEAWEPMAWLYMPCMEYTNLDPYVRWNLANLTEGRQETCSGMQAIAETPQLPEANYCAGSQALHIMHSLTTCKKADNYLAEVQSTPWPIWTQLKDITP